MPQTITFMRGLSASGKSTIARQLAEKTGAVRVNMDDIRAMLGLPYSKDAERLALEIQDQAVLRALRDGRDVIVDNTHLHAAWPKRIATLVWEGGFHVDYKIVDTLAVSAEECERRNAARAVSPTADDSRAVPDGVIARQARTLRGELDRGLWSIDTLTSMFPSVEPYTPDSDGARWLLVDLDGTLCDTSHRSPYDFSRLGDDGVNNHVLDVVACWSAGGGAGPWSDKSTTSVVLMSGRDEEYREATEAWLDRHYVPYDALFMRSRGDRRRDSVVKLELFDRYVRGTYNVVAAIDDRLRVCQTWRNLGIPVFRVGDPDSDF